jgi:hypothetical protein
MKSVQKTRRRRRGRKTRKGGANGNSPWVPQALSPMPPTISELRKQKENAAASAAKNAQIAERIKLGKETQAWYNRVAANTAKREAKAKANAEVAANPSKRSFWNRFF